MDTTAPQDQSAQTVANNSAPVTKTQQIGRVMEPPSISVNREQAPISPEVISSEIMKESTPEITIPSELAQTVKEGHDVEISVLPSDVQQTGMVPAKAAVPVITAVPSNIKIPMSYSEAVLKKKTTKLGDAVKWFAALVVYQWKKINPDLYK